MFTVVVLVGLVVVVLGLVLLGRANEGRPLDGLGLRSAQAITETREALEAEDLEQMLAAHNARRRARGEREMTVEDVEMKVMQDRQELSRAREKLLADRELEQLVEATNARRRARGLPERTVEEVRREFGGGEPTG